MCVHARNAAHACVCVCMRAEHSPLGLFKVHLQKHQALFMNPNYLA